MLKIFPPCPPVKHMIKLPVSPGSLTERAAVKFFRMNWWSQRSVTFADRASAGSRLADRLLHYRGLDPLVLGIARGGVVVGAPIARALDGHLEVIVPRKLPIPFNPEAGFGAVAEDGTVYLDHSLMEACHLTTEDVEHIKGKVLEEIHRRIARYRGNRPLPDMIGRTVILTDDGLATGYTMMAAIVSVRKNHPHRVVVAVPVSPERTAETVSHMSDEFICLLTVDTPVFAVASFYEDFHDLTDEEVIQCLAAFRKHQEGGLRDHSSCS